MKTSLVNRIVQLKLIVLFTLGMLTMQSPVLMAKESSVPIDFRTAIVDVAKKNIPAVVHIEVTQSQEISNPFLPFQNDPFFGQFFGRANPSQKFKQEVKGLGSGMIIDNEGHILTNNHVVASASEIEVLLANGANYKGKVIGTDPKTDLAVIQIQTKDTLPHIVFGNSDELEVGSWVVAIGHPRGLDETVTQGIISAKHRRGVTDPNSYEDFLQTDTAINPGNSGGPLLNLQGEVIGVNAMIVSQSGGSEGIGFAIPSNMAVHIANALITKGKVERGWLGVSIQDLTKDLASSMNLKSTKGALIAEVVENGPADKAGIKQGDVIISLGSKEVLDTNEFRNEVAASPIGKSMDLTLMRKDEKKQLTIKVGSYEDAAKILVSSAESKLGIVVRPLTAKETEEYKLGAAEGIAIKKVDSKGAFGKAGFEVDDIILGINNQPIHGIEDLANLMNMIKPNQTVAVLALDHRTGQSGYVQLAIN